MHIFEVTTPGTWLQFSNRDRAFALSRQLDGLKSQFFEANCALNLFEQCRQTRQIRPPNIEEWQSDSRRVNEIETALLSAKGEYVSWEARQKASEEARIQLKREKWANGSVPRELAHNVIFIYAKAFLYSLDGFDKFLGVLAKEPYVPDAIKALPEKMDVLFPNLRRVRNTAQHLEDRARGLGAGRDPKPLDLKPINNNLVSAPGGVLILNSLDGNRYGSTMSDGHYGEVEVSVESMSVIQATLQESLNSFPWRGPPQHEPSAERRGG